MNNKKNIWVNILLYSIYIFCAITLLFFFNYNYLLKLSGVISFILIFVRTLVLNALKPLNPFCHNNGLKYLYQKKNDLSGYERKVKQAEKSLIIVGVISLIIGIIGYLLQ